MCFSIFIEYSGIHRPSKYGCRHLYISCQMCNAHPQRGIKRKKCTGYYTRCDIAILWSLLIPPEMLLLLFSWQVYIHLLLHTLCSEALNSELEPLPSSSWGDRGEQAIWAGIQASQLGLGGSLSAPEPLELQPSAVYARAPSSSDRGLLHPSGEESETWPTARLAMVPW